MSKLKFRLKDALLDYEAKTGIRMTYNALSRRTGISIDTLKSMANRDDYNSSLKYIASVCDAIHCNPIEYLIWNIPEEDK
jgi:DNA-binding Xre family transcriptional regulator